MRMLISRQWLRQRIASDPDIETDAGPPISALETIEGLSVPKSYRPSNGTEGDIFWSQWCARCIKRSGCSIWMGAMAGNSPRQWVRDPDPTCTSFRDRRRETNYHCRQTGDLFK